MSVRMRHTHAHTRNRRSHHALDGINVVTDKETGNLRLPHRIDEKSGMYRGMQILPKKEVKEKAKSRAARIEEHKHDDVAGAKEPVHAEKHVVSEEREKKQGLMGRMSLGKAKSRSGFGGGAS